MMDVQARMLTHFAVQQFYYDEAALLDGRKYRDWLALFTDDIHYWMPVRRTMNSNELENEFTVPGATALFDDDKAQLNARIRKLETGYAWSEDPPSRTRHLITNVRVITESDTGLEVESNFHHYRTRLESEEDSWLGLRRDLLRRDRESFKIARRKIFLEQTLILSKNLSGFF